MTSRVVSSFVMINEKGMLCHEIELWETTRILCSFVGYSKSAAGGAVVARTIKKNETCCQREAYTLRKGMTTPRS